MVQMNRRRFVSQAAMSTFAAGFAVNGFCPPAAKAQIPSLIRDLLSDNPIMAVVDLFELANNSSNPAPTIADVVARIDGFAQTLKVNFDELQKQTRLIFKQELELNDFKRDTLDLASYSYSLNIATARGSGEAEVMSLSGPIDRIAYKLGSYGVMGSLTYINAIALQNSVHKILRSAPNVIIAANKPHDEKLGHIIYDGTDKSSLEYAIVAKRIEMASDPYYKNFQILKERMGEWYSLGFVTKYYEASGIVSTCDLRFTYNGFQSGELVGYRSLGPETFGANINGAYVGRLVRATYTPLRSNEALPILVRRDNSLVFPQNWPSGQALVNQINGIANDYKKLYNPNYGLEISTRTTLDFGMTPEHAKFRDYLINTGLNSVKRILAAAQSKSA